MNIQKINIEQLKPAPYNPRKSNKKQEEHLKKSLEKFGVVEPIVYNKRTGYIVGGHFRVRELKKLGYKEVDCVVVDLSEEDEKELNIRLNANTGDWDFDMLADWDKVELAEWGLDIPDFEVNQKGKIIKENIEPYKVTHVLLSFPPDKMIYLQEFLQQITQIEGVEYEQSSN